MRPSGDKVGDTAESVKLVSGVYSNRAVAETCRDQNAKAAGGSDDYDGGKPGHGPPFPKAPAVRGWLLPAGALCAAQSRHQFAHRRIALRRIFFERPGDQHSQRLRNIIAQRRGRSVNHLLQQFEIRRCREWPLAGQHLIEHHAERKHVAARVERLAGSLLRRHVCDGADDDSLSRLLFAERPGYVRGLGRICEFGQTEIRQLGVPARGDQDVIGLDIAVQNPGLMGSGQTIRHSGE